MKRLVRYGTWGLLAVIAGCTVDICCESARQACVQERTLPLTCPMEPNSTLEADTGDGGITVQTGQGPDCQLSARIVARAASQDKALRLAEQTQVSLVPTTGGIKVAIERPARARGESVTTGLTLTVPRQTSVDLHTGDGAIRITDLAGQIRARTSDGPIEWTGIESDHATATTSDGSVTLRDCRIRRCAVRTSDGSVTVEGIAAEVLQCNTSDGSIRVRFVSDNPRLAEVTLTTSDGNIDLTAPRDLSATVSARTGDGRIRTDLPIVIRGEVGRSLEGVIGQGEARITLRTHDGSITIH